MKTHIVYIPGLGDHYDMARRFILSLWHFKDISIELIPMLWKRERSYDAKVARILAAIEQAKGKRIILIGESAGGSMVLNIYAEYADKVHGALTICGKNTQANHVSPYLYQKNPAFKQSMYQAELSVRGLSKAQREAFISLHPLVDRVVPPCETLIPDCKEVRVWLVGHLFTIVTMLTIGSGYIVKLLRKS